MFNALTVCGLLVLSRRHTTVGIVKMSSSSVIQRYADQVHIPTEARVFGVPRAHTKLIQATRLLVSAVRDLTRHFLTEPSVIVQREDTGVKPSV